MSPSYLVAISHTAAATTSAQNSRRSHTRAIRSITRLLESDTSAAHPTPPTS